MDDLRVGLALRAVRRRLGWRQQDVADRAGVTQKLVSLAEAGQLERLSIRNLRAISRVLEVRLPVEPLWRGGQLPRLLDQEHAALVNTLAAIMRRHGWTILIEYTFNHFGERGAVDIVGWHARSRAICIVEVKSRILDVQDLHAGLTRKVRIVPPLLARERGWHARFVGTLVAVGDSTANRSVARRHAAIFDAALPNRGRQARTWLHRPEEPLAALWFLSHRNGVTGTRVSARPMRVRRPQSRSERKRSTGSAEAGGAYQ